MNTGITELVKFRSMNDVTEKKFYGIIDEIQNNFFAKLDGYIDTQLVKGENNEWLMIHHWTSQEAVDLASEKIHSSGILEKFSQIIEKNSVQLDFYINKMYWKK